MLDCYNNFIGIKCANDISNSDCYIEDLAGISIKVASQIADDKYVNGISMLRNSIDAGIKKFTNDVSLLTLPIYRLNKIIESISIGQLRVGFELRENKWKGIKVTKRSYSKNSKFLKIKPLIITIKVQENNFTDVLKIVDGDIENLYPFTIDASGNSKVVIKDYFKSDEVLILLNNNVLTPAITTVSSCNSCTRVMREHIEANGWDGNNVTNKTFGLSCDINGECPENDLACVLTSVSSQACLFAVGIKVVMEWKTSDRINPIITFGQKTADELLEYFEENYKIEIEKLKISVKTFLTNIDDVCVTCNQNFYLQQTP